MHIFARACGEQPMPILSELSKNLQALTQRYAEVKITFNKRTIEKLDLMFNFCQELHRELQALAAEINPSGDVLLTYHRIKETIRQLDKINILISRLIQTTQIAQEVLSIDLKTFDLIKQLFHFIKDGKNCAEIAEKKIRKAQEFFDFMLSFLDKIKEKTLPELEHYFLCFAKKITLAGNHKDICYFFWRIAHIATATRTITSADFIPLTQEPANKYQRKARLLVEFCAETKYAESFLGRPSPGTKPEDFQKWFQSPENLRSFMANTANFIRRLETPEIFQANRLGFSLICNDINRFIVNHSLPIDMQRLFHPSLPANKTDAADIISRYLIAYPPLRFFLLGMQPKNPAFNNLAAIQVWLSYVNKKSHPSDADLSWETPHLR